MSRALAMETLIPAWQNETLVPFEKLKAHELGLRHKAVSVFLMRDDQTLIQQRALSKYHTPGLWANSCCTHPHWGENDETCAQRRLEEELGVTGCSLSHKGTVEYRADVGNGLIEHEVVQVFTGECSQQNPQFNPNEVAQTQWISLSDLKRDVSENHNKYTPWLRVYLENHAELIFG